MDRRTATAISYTLIVNQVAQKHGIPEEDTRYLITCFAVTADTKGSSVVHIATKMLNAPPEVIDSLKKIISIIKEGTAKMEADPAFMEKLNARTAQLEA